MARIQNKFGLSIVGALLLLVIAALAGGVFAGPLDPPSGPGSTQENWIFQPAGACPAGFPITLSASGSYKLAQDITGCATKDGINITADNVTLDLNGFALKGVPTSGNGVITSGGGTHDIAVSNGTIRDWGSNGINAFVNTSTFENLRVRLNGGAGILTSNYNRISGNEIHTNTGDGITGGSRMLIEDNQVSFNSANGIVVGGQSRVVGNHLDLNGLAVASKAGISLSGDNITVSNNTVSGTANTGYGIHSTFGDGYQITGNMVSANTNTGISVAGKGNDISGNTVYKNTSGGGIYTTGTVLAGADNKIDGNDASNNTGDGIRADGDANLISNNNASGNSAIGIQTEGRHDTITGNTASQNSGGGIFVHLGSARVSENTASTNTGIGINAPNGGARIDSNQADHNTVSGIAFFGGVDGVCAVIRNSANTNGASPFTATNYVDGGGGCDVGPIGTAALLTSPWGNISE